jgi:hypothetical protein
MTNLSVTSVNLSLYYIHRSILNSTVQDINDSTCSKYVHISIVCYNMQHEYMMMYYNLQTSVMLIGWLHVLNQVESNYEDPDDQ